MKGDDWDDTEHAVSFYEFNSSELNPSSLNALLKLHELGWKEARLPNLNGTYFGKDKFCLYMQVPENLQEVNKEAWLQAVLDGYAALPVVGGKNKNDLCILFGST